MSHFSSVKVLLFSKTKDFLRTFFCAMSHFSSIEVLLFSKTKDFFRTFFV